MIAIAFFIYTDVLSSRVSRDAMTHEQTLAATTTNDLVVFDWVT